MKNAKKKGATVSLWYSSHRVKISVNPPATPSAKKITNSELIFFPQRVSTIA
jgi:hypothetical protein